MVVVLIALLPYQSPMWETSSVPVSSDAVRALGDCSAAHNSATLGNEINFFLNRKSYLAKTLRTTQRLHTTQYL
jgi:hypothetical protein